MRHASAHPKKDHRLGPRRRLRDRLGRCDPRKDRASGGNGANPKHIAAAKKRRPKIGREFHGGLEISSRWDRNQIANCKVKNANCKLQIEVGIRLGAAWFFISIFHFQFSIRFRFSLAHASGFCSVSLQNR
jgi:hypothetical protein